MMIEEKKKSLDNQNNGVEFKVEGDQPKPSYFSLIQLDT